MPTFHPPAIAAVFGLTVMFYTIASAQNPSRSAEEQTVLRLQERLLDARVAADPSVAQEVFADDGMYIHSSGVTQTKDQYLNNVRNARWNSYTQSELEVRVYGDAAVTHSLLVVLLGDRRIETVRTTGIFVKQAGRWREVSWQSSVGKFEEAPKDSVN